MNTQQKLKELKHALRSYEARAKENQRKAYQVRRLIQFIKEQEQDNEI